MTFNRFWNRQPIISWAKAKDPEDQARKIAARAYHQAQMDERARCIKAIESVAEPSEIPDHVRDALAEGEEKALPVILAVVQLTKESAVDAVKAFSPVAGGKR